MATLLSHVETDFWLCVKDAPGLVDLVKELNTEEYTVYCKRVLPAKTVASTLPRMDLQITLAHNDKIHGLVFELPEFLGGSLWSMSAGPNYPVDAWFDLQANGDDVSWVKRKLLENLASLKVAFSSKVAAPCQVRKLPAKPNESAQYQVITHPNKIRLPGMVTVLCCDSSDQHEHQHQQQQQPSNTIRLGGTLFQIIAS